MQTSNQANRAIREERVGQVWEEVLSGAQGTVEVDKYATVRVRADGATTVTIDGILAMTMASGEVEYFNAGAGNPLDSKLTVSILIGGANAYVQVARNKDRQQ